MMIMKAYKTRLEPNNKQRTFFERCAVTSRFVFNIGLREWQRQYEAGEKPSQFKLSKQFNAQKDAMCSWVRDVPYAPAYRTESEGRGSLTNAQHILQEAANGQRL